MRAGVLAAALIVAVAAPAVGEEKLPGEWCGKWRTKTGFIGDFCVTIEGVSGDVAWGRYEVETVRPRGFRTPMGGPFRGTRSGETLSFMMGGKVPVTLVFKGDMATGTMEATSGKTVDLGRIR